MEILNQFGFNIQLFLAQIVNFLILAFLFKRFLYKPILNMIQDRQKTIKKGLSDAELAAESLDKAKDEREKILNDASVEAKKILEETKAAAEENREELIAKSREDSERIMREARDQAKIEIDRIRAEGEKVVVSLTAALLEKTLADVIDKQTQEKIIQNTVKEVRKYEN